MYSASIWLAVYASWSTWMWLPNKTEILQARKGHLQIRPKSPTKARTETIQAMLELIFVIFFSGLIEKIIVHLRFVEVGQFATERQVIRMASATGEPLVQA